MPRLAAITGLFWALSLAAVARAGGEGLDPAGPDVVEGGGLLLLGFLLGGACLVALARVWRQPSAGPRPGHLGPLVRSSEPGLLGPGTPAPSGSVALWGVGRSDLADAVDLLLPALATGRTVGAALPAGLRPAPVRGGPVYLLPDASPETVRSFFERLAAEPDLSVAALVVLDAPSRDQVDGLAAVLPPGAGITVLAVDPTASLSGLVFISRVAGRWQLGQDPAGRSTFAVPTLPGAGQLTAGA